MAERAAAPQGELALPWDPRLRPLRADLLERYLAFIRADHRRPSHEALAELQHAHLLAIPFETLSPMLDEAVELDEDSIAGKLLSGRRGGYCFEHNLLFGTALAALGYHAEMLAARFLLGATEPRPRTHAAVRVHVDGRAWLADVGFGRTAFRGPLDLGSREPQEVAGFLFRISDLAGELVVELGTGPGEWEAQYLLDPRAIHRIDCEQLNLWVATDPRSMMRQMLIVLRPMPEGRRAIRHGRLVVDEPGRQIDEPIEPAQLGDVLATEFGLTLPAPLPALLRPAGC